jgi:NAD(P)-dependent dehydrogenase (short-subunit alcohol dehydrogenase family)
MQRLPGTVWTPVIPSTLPKEPVKQFGSQTIFGRAAQPAKIAPIFVFIASEQTSYVSGEIYGAIGGQMPMRRFVHQWQWASPLGPQWGPNF